MRKILTVLLCTVMMALLAANASAQILSGTVNAMDVGEYKYIRGGTQVYNNMDRGTVEALMRMRLYVEYFEDDVSKGMDNADYHTTLTIRGDANTLWQVTAHSTRGENQKWYISLKKHTVHTDEDKNCDCDLCGGPAHTQKSGSCECKKCGTEMHTYGDSMIVTNKCCCTVCYKSMHDISAFAAKDPTCTEKGNSRYWYCSKCHYYFLNENYDRAYLKKEDYALSKPEIPALKHAVSHVEEKKSTCFEKGNIEHWYCERCNTSFADEQAMEKVQDVSLPLDGHSDAVHYPGDPSTCKEQGTMEYWQCGVCNEKFSDKEMTRAVDDITLPLAGHSLTIHQLPAEADCTNPARDEYWQCSVCDEKFSDDQGREAYEPGTLQGALGHDWQQDYSYNEDSHWQGCRRSGCAAEKARSAHQFTLIVEKAPDAKNPGSGTEVCTACGYRRAVVLDPVGVPQTGDKTHGALLAGMLLMSGAAIVTLRKKRSSCN